MQLDTITVFEKEIFKEIYGKKKATDIFFFHEQFSLSPAHLALFVNKYSDEELIAFDGRNISLTKKGRNWVFNNRASIFLSSRDFSWKQIPVEYREEKPLLEATRMSLENVSEYIEQFE